MKRVLLLQLDGKTPNIALMRISAHHKDAGDVVDFDYTPTARSVERGLFDAHDKVYASAIFEWTRPIAKRLLQVRPDAVIGGSGWDEAITVESIGIATMRQDYTIYPKYQHSIGFTQRGCRLKCSFCKVPTMEGKNRPAASVAEIYRGEPWPKNLLLLDNDFFGQMDWQKRIDEMTTGRFKVCWNQGFNVRLIGDEEAAAISTTNYCDDQFKTRRLYTAWDNRKDEAILFRNLDSLVRYGVKPDNILVYMLVAYDHAAKSPRPTLTEDDFHRHARLREFGCRPYPMPFVRNRVTRGFQRWIIGAYDKRVSWKEWERAGYEPRNLGVKASEQTTLFEELAR